MKKLICSLFLVSLTSYALASLNGKEADFPKPCKIVSSEYDYNCSPPKAAVYIYSANSEGVVFTQKLECFDDTGDAENALQKFRHIGVCTKLVP